MIEHKTVSLADQVFERLETDILTGAYARGELLTETRLSEDMGVSRTPIREALRRLEQERLVEATGKGVAVVGISENDLTDIYEIRLHLEGLAAARAAEHAADGAHADALEALREVLDLQEYYVHRHDADNIKLMDSRFHEYLYRLAGSTVLYDALHPLHNKVQKFRRAAMQSAGRAEKSLEEHRRVFNCIAAHDPRAAEQAMIEHVTHAMDIICKKN